ncbi:hypothetical protein D3C85_1494900 [compost metagenome]
MFSSHNRFCILLCGHHVLLQVVTGHSPSTKQAHQSLLNHRLIHGEHEPLSESQLTVSGAYTNVHDIKCVPLRSVASDITMICDIFPGMLSMPGIEIHDQARHRACKFSIQFHTQGPFRIQSNMAAQLLHIPPEFRRERRREAFLLDPY